MKTSNWVNFIRNFASISSWRHVNITSWSLVLLLGLPWRPTRACPLPTAGYYTEGRRNVCVCCVDIAAHRAHQTPLTSWWRHGTVTSTSCVSRTFQHVSWHVRPSVRLSICLSTCDRLSVTVQSRFAETLTLTLNPNFGESGRHRQSQHFVDWSLHWHTPASSPIARFNNKYQQNRPTNTIEFTLTRLFMKIFRTSSPTVVIQYQRNFCFLSVALQIQIRTARFLQVFTATENICSLCLLFHDNAVKQLCDIVIEAISEGRDFHYVWWRGIYWFYSNKIGMKTREISSVFSHYNSALFPNITSQ